VTRCVRNMTSAKAYEASTLQDMRKGLMSSSLNRTLHANFELLSKSTKRYGLFRNCFNNIESAAAAKRHNTAMNPPPMWSLSGSAWVPSLAKTLARRGLSPKSLGLAKCHRKE
jgi:hypothetical protein